MTRKQALPLTALVVLAVVAFTQRKRLVGWRKRSSSVAAQETHSDQAIVRLYQALLKRLSSAGLPRLPSETPHEYLARMRESGLEGTSVFARLTDAYTSARYGDATLSPELVAELKQAAKPGPRNEGIGL